MKRTKIEQEELDRKNDEFFNRLEKVKNKLNERNKELHEITKIIRHVKALQLLILDATMELHNDLWDLINEYDQSPNMTGFGRNGMRRFKTKHEEK